MKAKIEKDKQYKAPEFVPLTFRGVPIVYDETQETLSKEGSNE